MRAAAGELRDGSWASTERLAVPFDRHGVPAYAAAVCHFAVSCAIARELGLGKPLSAGLNGYLRLLQTAGRQALAAVLEKVAWFDLELLLETYAQERRRALAQLDAFRHKLQTVTEAVTEGAGTVSVRSETMVSTTGETTKLAHSAAGASQETSANVDGVVAAAEGTPCFPRRRVSTRRPRSGHGPEG